VLPQFPAVVAPDDDDRVVREPEFLEAFHQPAETGVDVADARVITVLEEAGGLLGKGGQRGVLDPFQIITSP